MHLVASSGSAFAINGFAGLSGAQQLSFWLSFLLFNGYVVLEVICLAGFYFGSRPRAGGLPNPAAIWYFAGSVLTVLAFITTVWAAPAENAFLDDSGSFIAVGTRTVKVFIGLLLFAAPAALCVLTGALQTARRKRAEGRTLVI